MRKLRSLCGPSLACLIVSASFALPGAAQTTSYKPHSPQLIEVQKLTEQAMRHYHSGDIKAAIGTFEVAAAKTRRHFGADHLKFAKSLNNLALVYDISGNLERSEELYRQALAIVRRNGITDSKQLAELNNNLAAVVLQQCRVADARALYRRALRLSEATLGPEHADTTVMRSNVERLDRYLGAPSQATAGDAASVGQMLRRCVG